MSKFQDVEPHSEVTQKSRADFLNKNHSGTGPVLDLDPKAPRHRGIGLKLNDYELSAIREVAEAEDRSMLSLIRVVVMKEIERMRNENRS